MVKLLGLVAEEVDLFSSAQSQLASKWEMREERNVEDSARAVPFSEVLSS